MSASLLCETVTATSMTGLLAARDAARAGDMVELRLDGVADVDVAAALHGRRCPVVITCRPQWEGGRFDGSEDERRRLLSRAVELGAEYVDLEWAALRDASGAWQKLLAAAARRIVLSSHDFAGVPADLADRVRAMRGAGAGLVKIAVATMRLTDLLPLLSIGREGGAIVIGMGESGIASRLLASRFGSPWTYAGNGVAPGQMPAETMVRDFGFRRVGAETRLFGVVSTTAMHSWSPLMHNAAFEAAGIDAVYVPLQTTDFADFLTFAEALGWEGASVTIPFKRDALAAAASADALTEQVGAANTLRRRAVADGGPAAWDVTNTDVAGFLAPLEAALPRPLAGARAAVMGGGGSARAVIVALRSRGAQVTVHTRRPEQAGEVTALLEADAGPWPVPAGSWDLLVNCTPLGGAMQRDQSPLPGGPFTGALVYDLTYGAGDSALLREARAAGCAVLDGLPMLIAQAEQQFAWWTGAAPPAGVMRAAAERRLATAATPRATAAAPAASGAARS